MFWEFMLVVHVSLQRLLGIPGPAAAAAPQVSSGLTKGCLMENCKTTRLTDWGRCYVGSLKLHPNWWASRTARYIYIYTVHTYTYACIHTILYTVYIYTHTHHTSMYDTSMYDTSIHTSSYIYTCTYTCMYPCFYICVHTCIYMYLCIYRYISLYTFGSYLQIYLVRGRRHCRDTWTKRIRSWWRWTRRTMSRRSWDSGTWCLKHGNGDLMMI